MFNMIYDDRINDLPFFWPVMRVDWFT